jgi:hypothetical protein
MAEQPTPLPETDVIDGEVVDRGYNPADWAELNSLDRQHEREAMSAIAQQPLVEMASSGSDEEQRAEMLYNQFRGDRRSIGEDIANVGVTVAGGVGDLLQMGGNVLAYLMAARRPEVPFTTERLREKTGVRPMERGQLLMDLLAPGPAEIVKAGSMAMLGIRNLGKMDILEDAKKMIAKGDDPLDVFRKTGMYDDGPDGWKYWKVDRDLKMNLSNLEDPQYLDFKVPDNPGLHAIEFRMADIIDDSELFVAYPQMRNHRIFITARRHKDQSISLGSPETGGSFDPNTMEIRVYEKDLAWIRSTILHEVQHMTDNIEGLAFGSNPDKYTKLIDDWSDSVRDQKLIRKFQEGALDTEDFYRDRLSWDSHDAIREVLSDVHGYIGQLGSARFKEAMRPAVASAREMVRLMDEFGSPAEDLLQAATSQRRQHMSRIRTLFSELVENGLATEEQITSVIQNGPEHMREMAFQRYWNNAGEIRARLAQSMDKAYREIFELKDFKEIPTTASGARMGSTPFLDDVSKAIADSPVGAAFE